MAEEGAILIRIIQSLERGRNHERIQRLKKRPRYLQPRCRLRAGSENCYVIQIEFADEIRVVSEEVGSSYIVRTWVAQYGELRPEIVRRCLEKKGLWSSGHLYVRILLEETSQFRDSIVDSASRAVG